MISKKMTDDLNVQINKEIYSAYLYLSMAAHATSMGLNGIANWFHTQAQEELVHAQKFYDYINQQGGKVVLAGIDGPPTEFAGATDLFEKTLEHEKIVTKRIHDLIALAKKENDPATETFLQWFVTEQVEEEATPTEILQKLKLAGDSGNGLLMIDSELGARVFTPPAKN